MKIVFNFISNRMPVENEFSINKIDIFDSQNNSIQLNSTQALPINLVFENFIDNLYWANFNTDYAYYFK